MRKQGRPLKLTEDLQDQFVKYIRLGNFIDTTCAYVGIDKSTYYLWSKKGERESSGIYHEFRKAVQKAMAESEIRLLQHISIAAMSDWCASAWKLERKYPNKFALRDCVQLKSS